MYTQDLNPDHIESGSGTNDPVPGPASGHVNLEGVHLGSNLYPLDEELKREGVIGHTDEDLGDNSDGTNPGTEYLPPLNEPWEE